MSKHNPMQLVRVKASGMVRTGGRLRDEESGASMSRVSVTEQARLSLFLARAILRALLGEFAAFWIYRLPVFSGKNDRLVIAPQDLRTADAAQAAEIHSGRCVGA